MKLSLPTRLVLAFLAACVVGLVLVPVPAAQASGYVPISGAGSTWSQVAVDAWRADVRASGVVVNYAGTGSTDGRSQYIQGTVDFANTEIPFQNPPEPGQQAEVTDLLATDGQVVHEGRTAGDDREVGVVA